MAADLATLLAMKADTDRAIGALRQRLNDCGPRGNRSVESTLDRQEGRSAVLAELIAAEAPAEPAGITRCERCGRATFDPDRWDPEASTGKVYCDPCWDRRDTTATDDERHAAWLANNLLGVPEPTPA